MADEGLKKDLTPEEFQLFRDWIHHHSGIFLEDSKTDSLRISLVTRATRFGFVDYQEYFRLLSHDEDEFKELMNLVTINETSFFRFPAQFEAFRDQVIPEILSDRSRVARNFRVWSAGCSTGEEPYTIAMTLLDAGLDRLGDKPEVVGTDVSTQALERATRGVYPARAINNLEQSVVQRFFEPVKGGHRPIRRVRDLCTFSFHNLIKEPYPLALMSGWDVIFCRNVTIYFRLDSTRRVVNNFYESLNPGGYLFIGHSETLTTISDRFEPVEINGVFLYRKPKAKRGFTFNDIVERRSEVDVQRREAARERLRTYMSKPQRMPERRLQPEPVVETVTSSPEVGAGELVARAHAMLEEAQPAKALALAEKALELEPDNAGAHLVAAFAYADAGDFDMAQRQANATLDSNPLSAPARYVLGVIRQQQGDVIGALNEFKRTIYIDADFVLAHFQCANIYRAQGAYGDACREYENTLRALEAKPEGSWTAFLGGFRTDLLAATCRRSLVECRKGSSSG